MQVPPLKLQEFNSTLDLLAERFYCLTPRREVLTNCSEEIMTTSAAFKFFIIFYSQISSTKTSNDSLHYIPR